jgi:glutaredoxin
MKPTMSPSILRNPAALRVPAALRMAAVALALAGTAAGALAQAYRVVGPDGRVTYTDRPPTAAQAAPGGGTGTETVGTGLPYQTRQAMAKYPVSLYAGKNCGPCDQARQWLRGRGIPFTEYSVASNADIAALQARFGDGTLPVVTIGSQPIKGYSAGEMQAYADAAGYPAQARLGGYAWPAAVPLAPPAPAAAQAASTAASVPTPSRLPPPSKSGIQF